jgi:hypothetical protein
MDLHVIAFDIPFPANYGGAIAVYCQLESLHAAGARIILHCYEYGNRKPAAELEALCHEVHYYPRKRSLTALFSSLPFIMQTRRHPDLLRRLMADEYPILFEGIHTCAFIWEPGLKQRKKLVRMHNVEWHYYRGLAASEKSWLKKRFFQLESKKLQRVEARVLRHADAVLTLSGADTAYFKSLGVPVSEIPVFHPNKTVCGKSGMGTFALFHGKLSVPDNDRAAKWLVEHVFAHVDIPWVVAGMDPGTELANQIAKYPHIQLVANPDEHTMNELISEAHIHVLKTFAVAGIKLKLLNALYCGRHCVVDEAMVAGTSLGEMCYVEKSAEAMRNRITDLMKQPFTPELLEARKKQLNTHYNNTTSAAMLCHLIEN